jgi:hypothetical protein
LSFVGIIAGPPGARCVQPGCAADPQTLGGGIDAGEDLCVEAQTDRGRARVVVLRNGSSQGCWRYTLGWPRRSAVLSLIQFRSPALDEGDDLLHQFGHVDREAPEQRGYWIVPHDHTATSLRVDRLGYRVVLHDNSAVSPRASKAAQRDGSRPVPLILDVDRLGYRDSLRLLLPASEELPGLKEGLAQLEQMVQ